MFWLLAFGLTAVGALAAQQQPTFRGSAVLITVDAYPQLNGKIVEGLSADDFEVLEDGKPQKVENFDFVRVQPARSDDERRDPNSGDEGNKLAADPKNRVFVLFLDAGNVTMSGSNAIRQPLVNTLRDLLAPNDLFGVMTPVMRPRDLVFGRSVTTIEDQLARYWYWGAKGGLVPLDKDELDLYNAFDLDRCGKKRYVADGAVHRLLTEVLLSRLREDKALTSLEALITHLGGLREARTGVLLISSGWRLFERDQLLEKEAYDDHVCGPGDSPPPPPIPRVGTIGGQMALENRSVNSPASYSAELLRLANLDDGRRFREMIDHGRQRNITFYPVSADGLEVFDDSLSKPTYVNTGPRTDPTATPLTQSLDRVSNRVSVLRTLAENTDGIAVVNTNDLAAGLHRIVDDTSAYYLLGYYSPTMKMDGAYHKIEVKMKRPGLAVKARRGYFAPSAAAEAARNAAATAAAAAAPITDALSGLARVRPSADLHGYGFPRGGELKLVVEIPAERIAGGKFQAGADVEAALIGASGSEAPVKGRIEPAARGVLLTLPMPIASAGPWRVDLKVTAGTDRLEDRVTIEAVQPGTLLGEPILYRAAPGPRSPIRPVADLTFRRTERVHVEWPALKPLDQRQARLLGKNGQPLAVAVNLTEQPDLVAADINLAPLSAGDYVIELTVGSGAATEKKLLAIRVIQ